MHDVFQLMDHKGNLHVGMFTSFSNVNTLTFLSWSLQNLQGDLDVFMVDEICEKICTRLLTRLCQSSLGYAAGFSPSFSEFFLIASLLAVQLWHLSILELCPNSLLLLHCPEGNC